MGAKAGIPGVAQPGPLTDRRACCGADGRVTQLASAEELIDGVSQGPLGEILIRCNNVLYVRAAPDADGGMAED